MRKCRHGRMRGIPCHECIDEMAKEVAKTCANAPVFAIDSQVGGDHYRKLAIQPVEFCQRNGLGYCESNVIKYVSRHREKGGRKDIEKAIHYLQLLIEMEYPENHEPEGREG